MLILFTTALLFVVAAYVFGAYFSGLLKKILKVDSKDYSHFQPFLVGCIFMGTLLNCWSLFYKVNAVSVMMLIIGGGVLLQNQDVKNSLDSLVRVVREMFSRRMLVITLPVIFLIFLFAIIPPQHGDSGSYHFMSIRWIEEFKAMPGLANLHGRFGFNSSFFVTSAAFSFSKIFGQAIYPVNVGVIFCFYLWLVNKMRLHRKSLWSIVYLFIAVILFRNLLIVVSSPSPDLLISVIVVYLFIETAENIISTSGFNPADVISKLLLMLFAVTIKLSAVGMLPLAILLLFQVKWNKRSLGILLLISVVIICPWLIRNYILTGYLIYPLPFTAVNTADWKVPFEILNFDRLLINNGPKLISHNWALVDKMPLAQWLPLWIKNHFNNGLAFSLFILITSVGFLVVAILKSSIRKNIKLLFFFITALTAIVFWLVNSPDYRFGYSYIIAGLASALLYSTYAKPISKLLFGSAISILFIAVIFYSFRAVRHLHEYSISNYWFKPMPSSVFRGQQNLPTFNYRMLSPSVKLYIEDSTHNWNNAPLPAYMNFAPGISAEEIEMRGGKIEDGFRIKKKL